MDSKKITKELASLFAKPLPEYHTRHIVFWEDEEGEFAEQVEDIQLAGVKVLVLHATNSFAVKMRLCAEDRQSHYLVYDCRKISSLEDDWLLNLKLYSQIFHADLISSWMEEMGMQASPRLRELVKHYRAFFKVDSNRQSVGKLLGQKREAAQLYYAMFATLAKAKDIQIGAFLRALLSKGLEKEENPIYQSLVRYELDRPFWAVVEKYSGYVEDEPNLYGLAKSILLSASTTKLSPEHLQGLEHCYSSAHQATNYDLIASWLESKDSDKLYEIARVVEVLCRLPERFARCSVQDLQDCDTFPCIHECIAQNLLKEAAEDIIELDLIFNTVEKRRSMYWFAEVAPYYEGLLQLANMQAFFLEHSAGFHEMDPAKLCKQYCKDYYKMDSYYRLFHLSFQKALKSSHPLLDDLLKHVADRVEGLYVHWFLGKLGENWTSAVAEQLEQHGHILQVPKQKDFYHNHVAGQESKIYVIVSDAFRYELAPSLAETLQKELPCKIELSAMQAIFPTVTKFGMAALLPHNKLSLAQRTGGNLSVLVDGKSSEAGDRDAILKRANPQSVALQYRDFIAKKRAERQALVKGMQVVYIYHDRVDEASHTADTLVFPACEEAILELKNLIRIIVNDFGGANVLLTADHGFLYTYSPLAEHNKLDKSSPSTQDVEVERRYCITQAGAKPDYMLPVRLLNGETGYEAFAPQEYVRIKKKGGGLNYVHGGISLQEMLVPLLRFQHLRSVSKAYQSNPEKYSRKPVELGLLSVSHKISNLILSLNFYQKEPAIGNREAATFSLYFEDAAGRAVSDSQRIIADRTSENQQEREFRVSFHLRSQSYDNRAPYYLKIVDESGLQAPQKIEFQIDIAFAMDDFDFFAEE